MGINLRSYTGNTAKNKAPAALQCRRMPSIKILNHIIAHPAWDVKEAE